MIKHVSGEDNDLDILTKNTTGPIFEKHIPMFVRDDKYMGKDVSKPKTSSR